jgi:replicative DNA helicase
VRQSDRQGREKPTKPDLTDLRENGTIEQDADIEMFVTRENPVQGGNGDGGLFGDAWNQNYDAARLLIRMHMNGQSGDVFLGFHRKSAT